MTNTHPTLDRIAQGIKARREATTGDDTDTDKPSAVDALRDLMHSDNDPTTTLARLKRNAPTPTNEKDTQS